MAAAPRSSWLEGDGARLHVLEAGPSDGPLVLLLHGFPEFAGAWHGYIETLADAGFHLVAPDQRGYARSEKPRRIADYALDRLGADVLRIADAHAARGVRLVGHDWGGVVAWWVAACHPDRVERLAILNAPHPLAFRRFAASHPSQWLRSVYIALFQVPALPEWILGAAGMRVATRALVRSSRPGTFSEADLQRYREAWSAPGAWTGMLNWYRAAARRSGVHLPPRVLPHTLILWGMRDSFLDSRLARASLDLCEDGQLIELPDATHWLQHEEPSRVTEELLRFLR